MRIKQMNQLPRAERKPYNYLNKCTPDHPPLGGFMLVGHGQMPLYRCELLTNWRGDELLSVDVRRLVSNLHGHADGGTMD